MQIWAQKYSGIIQEIMHNTNTNGTRYQLNSLASKTSDFWYIFIKIKKEGEKRNRTKSCLLSQKRATDWYSRQPITDLFQSRLYLAQKLIVSLCSGVKGDPEDPEPCCQKIGQKYIRHSMVWVKTIWSWDDPSVRSSYFFPIIDHCWWPSIHFSISTTDHI